MALGPVCSLSPSCRTEGVPKGGAEASLDLDAPQRQRCNGLVANEFRNGRPQRRFCARHPLRNAATVAATSLPQRRNGRNGNGRNAGPECCILISVQPRRSPECCILSLFHGWYVFILCMTMAWFGAKPGPASLRNIPQRDSKRAIRNGNGNGRNAAPISTN